MSMIGKFIAWLFIRTYAPIDGIVFYWLWTHVDNPAFAVLLAVLWTTLSMFIEVIILSPRT